MRMGPPTPLPLLLLSLSFSHPLSRKECCIVVAQTTPNATTILLDKINLAEVSKILGSDTQ